MKPCWRDTARALAAVSIATAMGTAGAQQATLPFGAGMQLIWVTSLPGEPDYESVFTILRSDSSEATVRWAWNRGEERRWKEYERPLSARERRTARSFYYYAREGEAAQYRGTTPAMLSTALHAALRRGESPDAVLLEPHVSMRPFRGTLRPTGPARPVRLLLDGKPVIVAALPVTGSFSGEMSITLEILVHDSPAAPWILRSQARTEARVRSGTYELVRVETGVRNDRLADALRRECRTSIHNIYFATGSDVLDAASGPAIAAIAALLAANPTWQVRIVGHTDSVGTAAANLDLSKRRAARVVATLRTAHGVAAGRLAADGKGETQPAGDNGTAEGRAASRRVDLVRDCSDRPASSEDP